MIRAAGYLAIGPRPEELLSSYLVRCARFNGVSPYRFFSHHLGPMPVWNRDIDRTLSGERAQRLAGLLKIDVQRITGMMMTDFEKPLIVAGADDQAYIQGVGPWINAVGIYHRVRTRYGLQYCPHCLVDDDPAFVRDWRKSYVVICPRHKIQLEDACHFCDAPVVLHRSHGALNRCYHCHMSLGRNFAAQVPDQMCSELMDLQRLYDGTHMSAAETPGPAVNRTELLSGMRILFATLRRQGNGYLKRSSPELLRAGTDLLEFARTRERVFILSMHVQVLAGWPGSFYGLAEDYKLHQTHFDRDVAQMPAWLRSVVSELAPGRRRPRYARSALRSSQKTEHWRSRRARDLLAATGY